MAEPFSAEIDVLSENLAVRPGKIDQLKDAVGRLYFRERHQAVQPRLIDDDDFTGLDIPEIFGADQIQCAGLGRHDPAAVEFTQTEGS